MKDRVIFPRQRSLNVKLACPSCGHTVRLSHPNGNTIAVPLVCGHCGHRFRPRFFCPDQKAPEYHVFEAEALYVDNLNGLYTFCPQHTYTTYDLVGAVPNNGGAFAQFWVWLRESWSALLFQITLALEVARQRLFPRSR